MNTTSNRQAGLFGIGPQLTVSLFMFAIMVVGYVVLVATGHSGDSLVAKGITVAGLLGLLGYNADRFQRTNEKLDQITSQTNGVLDRRIQTHVTKVLQDQLHPSLLKGGGEDDGPKPPSGA